MEKHRFERFVNAGLLDRRRYPAGTRLFREGDPGDYVFFVEEGAVEIYREIEGGERLLGRVGAGGVFGEMALIDGRPRMASAVVTRELGCVVLDKKRFEEKLEDAEPFLVALLRIFVASIRSLEHRLDAVEKATPHAERKTRETVAAEGA